MPGRRVTYGCIAAGLAALNGKSVTASLLTDLAWAAKKADPEAFATLAGTPTGDVAARASGATLTVHNPGDQEVGEKFVAKWTYNNGEGGSLARFNIALYSGSGCNADNLVKDFCPDTGCPDSKGDWDVEVPSGSTHGFYSISVGVNGNPALSPPWGCSPDFVVGFSDGTIGEDDDVPTQEDDNDEYAGVELLVENPPSVVQQGGAFVAKWAMMGGEGAGVEDKMFDIDLYACGETGCDSGGCGTFYAALCPYSSGCSDSQGDYDVFIPGDASPGLYKVHVSVSGLDDPSACSVGTFEVVERTVAPTPTPTTAAPTTLATAAPTPLHSFSPTSAPTAFPTSSPTAAPTTVATPVPGGYVDYENRPAAPVKPECDFTIPVELRFASSTNRVYLEHTDGTRGGCVTLTDVYNNLTLFSSQEAPLFPVDPNTNEKLADGEPLTGIWMITSDLYVTDGVTVNLYGTDVGGDCDELRILSTSSEFYNFRGHGGSIDMLNTKVNTWDTASNGPHEWEKGVGRSYISCVSEVLNDPPMDCGDDGGEAKNDMGECRMDIVNSEVSYLGWEDTESYGLVWKVRGFCVDKSNLEVFDDVEVTGNILNSNIHHNYYGHYSYGHQGGVWSNNQMHDNVGYGFDPHDDSDWLIIHDNEVWDNGNHGIIASKRCDHVSIQNNHVWGGDNAGLFLHRSSDDAIVRGNYVHDNLDAGLAVMESFNALIFDNVFENNKYGVRFSVGCSNNQVYNNSFSGSSDYHLYTYQGTDPPDLEGTTGRILTNYLTDNTCDGVGAEALKIKEADGVVITGNIFTDIESFRFDDSTDTLFAGNTVPDGVELNLQNDACFAEGSQYDPICD